MKFYWIVLGIVFTCPFIVSCDSGTSESNQINNSSSQANDEVIIVPYSKSETPKVYKKWGSEWVKKINQMMPQAAEKIRGNPKCDAPESVILSEQKSRVRKEAIFIVDCANGERFYVSQKEFKINKVIQAQTDKLGEPSVYVESCKKAIKDSAEYPIKFDSGITSKKTQSGNIEVIVPYKIQNGLNSGSRLAMRCLVTTDNKIEVNPIQR